MGPQSLRENYDATGTTDGAGGKGESYKKCFDAVNGCDMVLMFPNWFHVF